MSSSENSLRRLNHLNNDAVIQNLMAQASSRYILLNTNEAPENFPPYTITDDRLNILAFYYLDIGCSFAENGDLDQAREPLEKGASLLEHLHSAVASNGRFKYYYNLVAALAYYVSFQYSKSYVLIHKVEAATPIARLLAHFLRREVGALKDEVALLMVDPTYRDAYLASEVDEDDGRSKIYEIVIGRSLSGFVNYFETGEAAYLNAAKEDLHCLKEIAAEEKEPAVWWIVRLIILIGEGFEVAALWNVLPRYFGTESSLLKPYITSLTFRQPKGIYELFLTQRKCLDKVVNSENGCIVSIPTSSGKTRIAELAILDCLTKYPGNKILYIAPFRSLAFEIEHTLEPVMDHLGKLLSHLYGGGLFTELDEMIFEESDLIIATPEKASDFAGQS